MLDSIGDFLLSKDTSEIIKNYATCVAIVIGGIWAYIAFIRKRERYPRASISHDIIHRKINGKTLLRVGVCISNNGDTIMSLGRKFVRVQQMIPCSEDVLKTVGGDRTKEDEAEVPWPLLSEVELSGEKDEIEPGESEEFHFDFVIDPEIETVIVYSYVKNQIKRDREIGWNKTSVYDIK